MLLAENKEAPAPAPVPAPTPAPAANPPVTAPAATPADRFERRPPRWQDATWLGQMDRLRSHPRAGDIQNGPLSASVVDVFELDEASRAKVKQIMDEYDAAIIEQARRWNKEAEGLRAEFEQRLTEAVPEARRDAARKVLDFSHRNWSSSFEQEEQYKKEYAEKRKAADAELARNGNEPDRRKEIQQQMSAWVQQRRKTLSDPDRETIKQLREMLSPEEAARLERYDRSRPIMVPVQPPAGAQAPAGPKMNPREDRPMRPRERRKQEQEAAQTPPAQPAPAVENKPAPEVKAEQK